MQYPGLLRSHFTTTREKVSFSYEMKVKERSQPKIIFLAAGMSSNHGHMIKTASLPPIKEKQ